MKGKYIFLAGSILLGAFIMLTHTSCSDEDEKEAVAGTTTFDSTPITFEGEAREQEAEIKFYAGNSWTATLSSTVGWLEINPTHGEAGEATIKVRPLTDNMSATSRSINLNVMVDGDPTTYTVKITQNTVEASDMEITGDVNEGVMTLQADANGNNFIGVLQITSSRKWEVITEDASGQWLSFARDKEPQDGKETTVELTVSGAYSKFNSPDMTGTFTLQAEGTKSVTIEVVANTICKVYENERATENEQECTTYELVDTIIKGTFQTTFYVESNVKWEARNIPEWLQVANTEGATNILANGEINPMRVGIGLLVNPDYLSSTSRNATINLVNIRGEVLKTISLTFNGTGSNYLQHDFVFPATDPTGNEFSFEARAEYIDLNNRDDYWKKMELPFHITTSTDYTSLENAPYHLILCKGKDGVLQKEEVHWATLRMGDAANNTSNNGLYTKELYLRANDRPDSDDLNGLTLSSERREAFMFIVPTDIGFNDLFENGTSSLKKEYELAFSRFVQKQDHNAGYYIKIEGLNNNDEISVPAEGCTTTYNVIGTGSSQIGSTLKRLFKPEGSDVWEEREPTSAQSSSIYLQFNDNLKSITLNVGPNSTSSERRFRFYIHAFRGDGYDDINIFQFDIIQPSK